MKNSNARTFNNLLQLKREWNQDGDLKEEMEKKRVAEELERAQLVNELESFRTNSVSFDQSQMSVSEEIKHYLNGFDFRMYEWMAALHSESDGALKHQIEEFATKLAEHRATYPRPPPHRRGNQEDMPLFDAFIRMRDNNMKILQDRIMRKDHIMFGYDRRFLERSSMIQMMMIMETIGQMIDYPGVQEMVEKNRKWFGSGWLLHEEQVLKLLVGTVDIRQVISRR